ncbi:nucleoside 2-deoxyribosyltransferase [Streptomyces chrestomyceticus]|uniref:Nucleoside 2-deoxyribosyltransferase n=1 Tax=Streptomyces chrestomyceticus TaxID=68185 RepID=A0ABU7WQ60_9ACTN
MTSDSTATRPTALREVFVGGPFLQLVDPKTGLMSDSDRLKFHRLIEHFEQRGATVYNAHRREAWGAEFLTATEATKRDYLEISRSDLFIAFPGVPASAGTHVEIGWASALRKPMVLMLEKEQKHTFLVTGLENQANVEFIWFADPAEIYAHLDTAVDRVLARSGERTTIG